MKKLKTNLPLISFIVWFLSIIAFVILLAVATKGFSGTVQKTNFGSSPLFLALIRGVILLGFVSFGVAIISSIYKTFFSNRPENKKKNKFILFLKFITLLAIFPLVLIFKQINPLKITLFIKKNGFKKLLSSSRAKKLQSLKIFAKKSLNALLVIAFLLPIWVVGYEITGMIIGRKLGFINESIAITGTGSMYPTFPKGQGKTPEEQAKEIIGSPGMKLYPNGVVLFGKRFFSHNITRGDIVSFRNKKTEEITEKMHGSPSGFIKRIIGLPGDKIEIKDGLVILNGSPIKEQYIAKARSTFGGQFLPECHEITVSENQLFVMGDNRKGSGDSRHELGFIDFQDIDHVLALKKQPGTYDQHWRDTSKDFNKSSKIKLDKQKYLELLNEKRKEVEAQPLKYQPRLEESAFKRGEVILKYDDFSFEATRSGYTMLKAMSDAGYSNITYGEAPQQGYYEAEELIENQFEFPETKNFLLNKDYQETGIAEVEGTLNGCPAQILVQHFAGYVPPNYKTSDTESWEQSLAGLKEIRPSWENIRTSSNLYSNNKDKAERIIQIINIRISRIEAIVSRMRANQWLTKEEQGYIDQDLSLYNEQQELAKFLNEQKW